MNTIFIVAIVILFCLQILSIAAIYVINHNRVNHAHLTLRIKDQIDCLWSRNSPSKREVEHQFDMVKAEIAVERDIRVFLKMMMEASIPNYEKIQKLMIDYRDIEQSLDDVGRSAVANPLLERIKQIEKEIELIVYPNKGD